MMKKKITSALLGLFLASQLSAEIPGWFEYHISITADELVTSSPALKPYLRVDGMMEKAWAIFPEMLPQDHPIPHHRPITRSGNGTVLLSDIETTAIAETLNTFVYRECLADVRVYLQILRTQIPFFSCFETLLNESTSESPDILVFAVANTLETILLIGTPMNMNDILIFIMASHFGSRFMHTDPEIHTILYDMLDQIQIYPGHRGELRRVN
jgi:hypothetical protein